VSIAEARERGVEKVARTIRDVLGVEITSLNVGLDGPKVVGGKSALRFVVESTSLPVHQD
jgi:hypothetical protein